MRDEPLAVHDAKLRLHGVEVQLAGRREPLVDGAHAAFAEVPQDLEDFDFAIGGIQWRLTPGS